MEIVREYFSQHSVQVNQIQEMMITVHYHVWWHFRKRLLQVIIKRIKDQDICSNLTLETSDLVFHDNFKYISNTQTYIYLFKVNFRTLEQ